MKPVNQTAKWMVIVSILITIAALAVGLLALMMKHYIIVFVMLFLSISQLWICWRWKKRL